MGWVGSVLPMTTSPWCHLDTGIQTLRRTPHPDRLFQVERGSLQLDDPIRLGDQGIQQPISVGQPHGSTWLTTGARGGTDQQDERAPIGQCSQMRRRLPEDPPGLPQLHVLIVQVVEKAGGNQDPSAVGLQGVSDALGDEGFELMHGEGPGDVDAVEELLGWPVESRRDFGDQEGIEGVGRVDEDDMLSPGEQRGDRSQGIGEDGLAAVKQDEAALRPPTVEGEGELGKEKPGRRNPFHD